MGNEKKETKQKNEPPTGEKPKLPRAFWLAIMFEFFERGSYYGMMSILAVYFTDVLSFSKESAGVILSVIQPILYFLPIVAGALADRFGYRRALTVAFALLGTGYLLTSQVTSYEWVFLCLVVMALGAGTFKPIISGTIARSTTKENSSIAFGIFYWTINLGAFLFPLILVPTLKSTLGWNWVFVASAVGTGIMILPTLLFFKEPTKVADPKAPEVEEKKKDDEKEQIGLLQTLANAFEIIYSPVVLLFDGLRGAMASRLICGTLLLSVAAGGVYLYITPTSTEIKIASVPLRAGDKKVQVLLDVDRNQTKKHPYEIKAPSQKNSKKPQTKEETPNEAKRETPFRVVIYKPSKIQGETLNQLASSLEKKLGVNSMSTVALRRALKKAKKKTSIIFRYKAGGEESITLKWKNETAVSISIVAEDSTPALAKKVHRRLLQEPGLQGVRLGDVKKGLKESSSKPFALLFTALLLLGGLLIILFKDKFKEGSKGKRILIGTVLAVALVAVIWFMPQIDSFTKTLCTILSITLLSLWLMDLTSTERFRDHAKFLMMIAIYSGFWILYFQMFGSVLWYVKAYVDATPLNESINSLLSLVGVTSSWRFDIEHVTVINAGTIICLQILISNLVKKTPALPTMVVGIFLGTVGMAILAVSTHIWVFMIGIVMFSIGEMTAHPKFISYVGLTAPQDRVAMYMGYLFLYGVIGSSIGSIMGAKMYVHFVDHQNQPDRKSVV